MFMMWELNNLVYILATKFMQNSMCTAYNYTLNAYIYNINSSYHLQWNIVCSFWGFCLQENAKNFPTLEEWYGFFGVENMVDGEERKSEKRYEKRKVIVAIYSNCHIPKNKESPARRGPLKDLKQNPQNMRLLQGIAPFSFSHKWKKIYNTYCRHQFGNLGSKYLPRRLMPSF